MTKPLDVLTRVINEEIEALLKELISEQQMQPQPPNSPEEESPPSPPAAGAGDPFGGASPPGQGEGDPNSTEDEMGDATPGDPDEEIRDQLSLLAKGSDDDIRKTIIAKTQDGAEKESMDALLSYVEQHKHDTDPSEQVPENVVRIAAEVERDFGITPPPPSMPGTGNAPAPAPAATQEQQQPISEKRTRLQTLVLEYLRTTREHQ